MVAIPAMSIEPLPIPNIDFSHYDYLFFVSANAVRLAPLKQDASDRRMVAIGKQTAEALKNKGCSVDIVPRSGFTTEDLLAEPELQDMTAKRCLILRGEGGREALKQQLSDRGAEVEYLDLYRRVAPRSIPDDQLGLLKKASRAVGMFTSVESLDNFIQAISEEDRLWLWQLPLIVGSQRIAGSVRKMDANVRVIVAKDPSDQSMVNALEQWATKEAS